MSREVALGTLRILALQALIVGVVGWLWPHLVVVVAALGVFGVSWRVGRTITAQRPVAWIVGAVHGAALSVAWFVLAGRWPDLASQGLGVRMGLAAVLGVGVGLGMMGLCLIGLDAGRPSQASAE